MNYKLTEFLAYLIGIAAIIGLIKIRTIHQANYPFILFLWLGFINEILSTIFISLYHTNVINSNIYVLFSTVILLYQFKCWNLFSDKKNFFLFLALSIALFWIYENFIFSSFYIFNGYSRVIFSLLIILMSIHSIRSVVSKKGQKLAQNHIFIACISLIFFYTSKAIVEIFWINGLNSSKIFRIQLHRINVYVNLVTNIFYVIVILWMPKKQKCTFQYSLQ
ncbi:MAG: hypothetical protein EAZ13_05380 [Sphingobacteriia bacterium]|nr:MAG: hypothetical protein EAZ41_06695 [Sphingobacteriia bacterium]TAG30773.1 MAG: hypothetical protein EAZ35_06125 [Sphingobacteriia bacterium]TAH07673.1 MAG: hypothetical protein EAZ13_05380 [Sphingobacteriia bacterium]